MLHEIYLPSVCGQILVNGNLMCMIHRATIPSLFERFVLILQYYILEKLLSLFLRNLLICDLRPYFFLSSVA